MGGGRPIFLKKSLWMKFPLKTLKSQQKQVKTGYNNWQDPHKINLIALVGSPLVVATGPGPACVACWSEASFGQKRFGQMWPSWAQLSQQGSLV